MENLNQYRELCRLRAWQHSNKMPDDGSYNQKVDFLSDWLFRRISLYNGMYPDSHHTTIVELIWRLGKKFPEFPKIPKRLSVEIIDLTS